MKLTILVSYWKWVLLLVAAVILYHNCQKVSIKLVWASSWDPSWASFFFGDFLVTSAEWRPQCKAWNSLKGLYRIWEYLRIPREALKTLLGKGTTGKPQLCCCCNVTSDKGKLKWTFFSPLESFTFSYMKYGRIVSFLHFVSIFSLTLSPLLNISVGERIWFSPNHSLETNLFVWSYNNFRLTLKCSRAKILVLLGFKEQSRPKQNQTSMLPLV